MNHRLSFVPLDPMFAPPIEKEEALVRQMIADGVVEETLDGYVSGANLRLLFQDRDAPTHDVMRLEKGKAVVSGAQSAGEPGELNLQIRSFAKPKLIVGKNTFELKLACGHVTSMSKFGGALDQLPVPCPECARSIDVKDVNFGNAGALARFEVAFVGPMSYSLLVRRPYLDKIASLLGCKVKWIHLES